MFSVPNRLVEEHRERMRMDGEEEQEIEITQHSIQRRRKVFLTVIKKIQAQLEKLPEDIQEVKGEIKNSTIWRSDTCFACLFTSIRRFFVNYL